MLIAKFYFGDSDMFLMCLSTLFEMGHTPLWNHDKHTITVLFTETEKQNFLFIKRFCFPTKVEKFGSI